MTMIDPLAVLKKITPTPQVENNLSNVEKKEKITALFTDVC